MDGIGTLAHAEAFQTRGPTSVGTGLLFGGSNTLPETVAEALSRQGWSLGNKEISDGLEV